MGDTTPLSRGSAAEGLKSRREPADIYLGPSEREGGHTRKTPTGRVSSMQFNVRWSVPAKVRAAVMLVTVLVMAIAGSAGTRWGA